MLQVVAGTSGSHTSSVAASCSWDFIKSHFISCCKLQLVLINAGSHSKLWSSYIAGTSSVLAVTLHQCWLSQQDFISAGCHTSSVLALTLHQCWLSQQVMEQLAGTSSVLAVTLHQCWLSHFISAGSHSKLWSSQLGLHQCWLSQQVNGAHFINAGCLGKLWSSYLVGTSSMLAVTLHQCCLISAGCLIVVSWDFMVLAVKIYHPVEELGLLYCGISCTLCSITVLAKLLLYLYVALLIKVKTLATRLDNLKPIMCTHMGLLNLTTPLVLLCTLLQWNLRIKGPLRKGQPPNKGHYFGSFLTSEKRTTT